MKKNEAIEKYIQVAEHSSVSKWLAIGLLAIGFSLVLYGNGTSDLKALISQDVALNFGTALIPAALIGILYEFLLRRNFVQILESSLREILGDFFEDYKRVKLAGLNDVHSELPSSKVYQSISTAQQVKILQTWIPDIIPILNSLRTCLANEGQVRVLLLDPLSDVALIRSKDLGYQSTDVASSNITNNLYELKRLSEYSNLSVRLYDSLPAASIYSTENDYYLGFYWKGIPGIQSPQFQIGSGDSDISKILRKHFEATWELAREVNWQEIEVTDASSDKS